ncbi:MAG TPA: exonuclease domain-containing protein [Microbacteriaceae bacterium]|nr:exonuclease domain-containing protein [Microbacteriaceae bacterium]
MPKSFVAIDFETANSFRGSPCELGLAKFIDGKLDDVYRTLLRPPAGHAHFDSFNIMLHGIQEADVRDAPELIDILPGLVEYVEDLPLVAHNAAFDLGVLRDTLDQYSHPYPNFTYYCTLVMSRRVLDLPSYSLPYVADELGVELSGHHSAAVDARVSGEIAIRLLERRSGESLEQLASSLQVVGGRVSGSDWSGCHRRDSGSDRFSPERLAELMALLDGAELNPHGEISGRRIVFTGTLGSMTRAEAHAHVLKAGGVPEKTVTRHTDLLVFGVQDRAHLRPGSENSKKYERAMELRESGSKIEILDEVLFLRLLRGD